MEGISDSGKVEVRSWKQILKITHELQVERCQISTSLQEKRAFIRLSPPLQGAYMRIPYLEGIEIISFMKGLNFPQWGMTSMQ